MDMELVNAEMYVCWLSDVYSQSFAIGSFILHDLTYTAILLRFR